MAVRCQSIGRYRRRPQGIVYVVSAERPSGNRAQLVDINHGVVTTNAGEHLLDRALHVVILLCDWAEHLQFRRKARAARINRVGDVDRERARRHFVAGGGVTKLSAGNAGAFHSVGGRRAANRYKYRGGTFPCSGMGRQWRVVYRGASA